jgi:hypothetical protein
MAGSTSYFTNAAPQMAAVNQRNWLGLEQYILRNTRSDDMAVSVFTGPVLPKTNGASALQARDAKAPQHSGAMTVDRPRRRSSAASRVTKGDVLAYVTPPLQAIDVSDMRQRQGELDQQIAIVERRVARFVPLAATGAPANRAIVSEIPRRPAKRAKRTSKIFGSLMMAPVSFIACFRLSKG